ncbi:MAG: hypothetical protein ACK5NF_06430 [Bacilli bacterium]
MLIILKYLFSNDTKYTRCLVCGKKIEETVINKYAPICDREYCNEMNYTSASDMFI